MIKPFSTSLPSVSFNRDKGKDPACNLCDLLLVSTPQEGLDHVDFGSKESTTNLWICSGVGGLVRHNGSDRWLVGKPFNKTGDSLPQLQWLKFNLFLNKSLFFPAVLLVVEQYFWLSLLNYCPQQQSVAGVLFMFRIYLQNSADPGWLLRLLYRDPIFAKFIVDV